MGNWWESLSLIKQIYYLIAIPSTIILIIQSVMTLAGLGEGADGDLADGGASHGDMPDGGLSHDGLDGDLSAADAASVHDGTDVGHHGTLDGLRFFTLRGIIAFLAVFGWTGVVLTGAVNMLLALALSAAAGIAAMMLVGLAFYGILKLQSQGNLDYSDAIGLSGEAYLAIPPERSGTGKVTVTLQERLIEVDAVTDEPVRLATGTRIRVTGILGNNVLIVMKD